ncbi:MAG: nucleotidyltransferase domain-containing protein [Rhodocyclaceae bacterium]|nr:nucleotidyltransferase domain-containing protein [Rhodocyclaceae bacterium]
MPSVDASPAQPIRGLDLKPAHLEELRRLLRAHAPGAQVWAYGSRVIGGAHEGSDLDLVLRQPDDLTRPTPTLAALRTALQDSRLPMRVDVHDWADLPESFRREIGRKYMQVT